MVNGEIVYNTGTTGLPSVPVVFIKYQIGGTAYQSILDQLALKNATDPTQGFLTESPLGICLPIDVYQQNALIGPNFNYVGTTIGVCGLNAGGVGNVFYQDIQYNVGQTTVRGQVTARPGVYGEISIIGGGVAVCQGGSLGPATSWNVLQIGQVS